MNLFLILIGIQFVVILVLAGIVIRMRKQIRQATLGLDEIAEDTLKSLYHLSQQQSNVFSRDLIRAADLQPERYPVVQAELMRRGWMTVNGENINILPAGEKRALELIRAHRIWERYLADKEGMALDSVHAEAMRREHLSSPQEIAQMDAALGFPQFDPHGDPIPSQQGEMPAEPQTTALVNWPEHLPGRIAQVEDEPPALFSQLMMLGLSPGAQIEVDERTPGRILVWSGRQRIALTPAAARQILVVAATPEQTPLSEMETGFAARVGGFAPSQQPASLAHIPELRPGVEISAIKADPLGEPVYYRVEGREFPLSRIQSNRILLDADTIHEIPLPRRSFIIEEIEHAKEVFRRYGSGVVLKRGLLFLGPAFLISVGYMDPGNWGTDIEGGARFGYRLLWVILLANLMAILLQILSAKLGIATGQSLPEVCRNHYPRWASISLWVTAEIASMATDLAEFLGGAVGFHLLFGLPLFPAALLTGGITLLILLLERYGMRKVEMVIIGLIAIIGFVYMLEIGLAKPDLGHIMHGLFVPSIPIGATLVVVGIIGATVMPHNLYLHSALIQTRVRPSDSLARKKSVYRMAIMDSVVALNGAFFVNAAILTMSATAFAGDRLQTYSLESAYQTLTPVLGPLAGTAFAFALLASGLSSSTTATMAGQVVMEGFLHHRVNVWLRRGITMVPSLIIIGLNIDPLQILILSQVSLSFQLPFAMVPLILFTGNPKIMGDFANNRITNILAWLIALIILSLNGILIWQILHG